MKTAVLKIKKTIRAKVTATVAGVKIRFPKQSLGAVTINLITPDGECKMLKSFELWIAEGGDKIKVNEL